MKVVMIIDKELPVGLIANTAAVLGASLGRMVDGLVGGDLQDADGNLHRGITTMNIPILGGTKEQIRSIRARLYDEEYAAVATVDFNAIAQRSLDYCDYGRSLASAGGDGLSYLGICLYGPQKKVSSLTGSIGLLR
ncbi:DUF2000 domain-containing protein [Anaeroselena agilis]|uniref:DUF2000 domain-containing protein n=1 Tax=Anaeroselena agilis TaxID=3063788 RepID=A0ABU3P4W7_9FIRM|nr:DUF2000 domain-containing protein [Selenomonadales bacterium 4137-cl]